jgi:hypothetical protein
MPEMGFLGEFTYKNGVAVVKNWLFGVILHIKVVWQWLILAFGGDLAGNRVSGWQKWLFWTILHIEVAIFGFWGVILGVAVARNGFFVCLDCH